MERSNGHVAVIDTPGTPSQRFAEGLSFVPSGDSGLARWGGVLADEPVTKLTGKRWYDTVKLMRYNPVVKGMLFAVEMLIRRAEWNLTPAEGDDVDPDEAREIADFVESCRFDMRTTWEDSLAAIVSFLPYGFSLFEVVYKRRLGDDGRPPSAFDDGRIGWAEWAPRAQDTLEKWVFDDFGNVVAFLQKAPAQMAPVLIPLNRCLHFRAGGYWNSPEGESVLRAAYSDWDAINKLQLIEAIGIERDLAGLPVIKVPAELLMANAPPEFKAALEEYRRLGRDIRQGDQASVVLPSDRDDKGNELYSLTLLNSGGQRQFDTSAVINRRAIQMTMAMLSDYLMVGHGQTGSYALSQDKTRLFTTAISAWLDVIANVINDQGIKTLMRVNGIDRTLTPELRPGPLDEADLVATGDLFTKMQPFITELNADDRLAVGAHIFDLADWPNITTTAEELEPEPVPEALVPENAPEDVIDPANIPEDDPALAATT